MSPATSPGLEQAIAQLEMQLAQLKKDQTLLQDLAVRKAELQKELQRVNGQIARVTGKVASFPAGNALPAPKPQPPAKIPIPTGKAEAVPAKAPAAAKKSAPAKAASADKPRLAELIIACLKEAKGRPLTVRQLTDETLKRGFTTASSSPYKIVESRIQDLSKKGVLAHAKGQPGWVLGKGAPAKSPHAVAQPAAKPAVDGAAPKKLDDAGKPPLRQHIVNALQRSKRPLSLKELSQNILTAGYKTASSDFANVLGVALKKMSNIKRVAGQGYVLKAGKA